MAQRPKLNRVWASNNSNLRRDPGDTKYITGWVSEIPTYQVLNFLQHKVDTTFLAIVERGIAEWGGDISYAKGAISWDEADGKIYVSSVASPDKTKSPSKNPSQWVASSIQVTRTQFDNLVKLIDAHIANKNNPHGVTAAQINAYTKVEVDQIVAQYRAEVLAHKNDTNNPHKTRAVDIGAVPVTGGEYTGNVVFPAVYFGKNQTAIGIDNNDMLYLSHINGRIKLAKDGKVIVGNISAPLSPVVTEKTFPDLRLTGQPNFAQPTPTFIWDLMFNLNLRVGVGYAGVYVGAGDDDYVPSFANDGMLVCPSRQLYIKPPKTITSGELSYCADIRVNVRGSSVGGNFFSFGSAGMIITLRTHKTTGVVTVIAEMGGTLGGITWQRVSSDVVWGPGEVKRVAVVCDKTGLTLFINGVDLGTKDFIANSVSDEDVRVEPKINGISSGAEVNICGFKAFNQRLSSAQVSAL